MVGGQHFNFEGRDCLTPTLDSLVNNGINFTEAFAASTVCGPSRYALMTGRWASRNTSAHYASKYPLGTLGRFGVSDTDLEEDGQNLGTWLQQAGYRTGFVGKSHLVDDYLLNTSNWDSGGLITYSSTIDPALDATVNGAMHHNHRVLTQRMREFGFDYVSGYYRANLLELRNDHLNVHNQEWITKNALDFIDENHAQHFFLYMAPTINHGPVRNDLSKSLLSDPHYTSAGYLPNEDYSFMPTRQSIVDEVNAAGKQLISARETWIDYSMAAISNKLAAHGLVNDTLIIFTADHGEKELNSSPAIWGKSSLYDLGMRVPLVMHWPGGISSPGRVYNSSVSQIDFVPTLLELAGATNLPTRVLDGTSLVPVLNGSTNALRDDVFCEIGYARGVRSNEWKYIAVRYTPSVYTQINNGYLWKNFDTGLFTEPRPYYVNNSSLGYLAQKGHPGYYDDDQLYDLVNDPMEQNNLYGQHPEIAYNLKMRLGDYMGDIPDRPFRQFSNTSKEFSPAPSTAPTAPGSLQMQFQGVDSVQLNWSDVANSELGYIVEQSTNGAPFVIVDELPSGSNTATVAMDPAIEDVMLRVSSYNALGDSAAASEVDLLAPENWRYRTFGSTTSSNSQWTVDPDGDGLETIWEYAFATDPLDSNSTDRINGEVLEAGSNTWLQITVPRDSRRDVVIDGRVSTNLSDWAVGAPHTEVVEESAAMVVLKSSVPVDEEQKQFIGAEVSIP
jgi:arylsulfatase A-like enzyme